MKMGSREKQSALWGARSNDWAAIQEQTCMAGYKYVLNWLNLNASETLLDIGCGSGLFCSMARQTNARVTGFDATPALVEQAKQRIPGVTFTVGEMEELPFANNSFDVVTGFNSFQYAANVPNALTEAKRVLKPGGRLAAMIWGDVRDCEAASFLKAAGSLMPPPQAGAPGPFALTEDHLLEKILTETGFNIINTEDIRCDWVYPDKKIALKGLLSAGPVANAIAHSGLEKVTQTILASIEPYVQTDGSVVYQNKFRIVTVTKPD